MLDLQENIEIVDPDNTDIMDGDFTVVTENLNRPHSGIKVIPKRHDTVDIHDLAISFHVRDGDRLARVEHFSGG